LTVLLALHNTDKLLHTKSCECLNCRHTNIDLFDCAAITETWNSDKGCTVCGGPLRGSVQCCSKHWRVRVRNTCGTTVQKWILHPT